MKKLFTLFAVAVLTLSLFACAKGDKPAYQPATEEMRREFNSKAVWSTFYAMATGVEWADGRVTSLPYKPRYSEMIISAYRADTGEQPPYYTHEGDLCARLPVSFFTENGRKYYGFDEAVTREILTDGFTYFSDEDAIYVPDGLGCVTEVVETELVTDGENYIFHYEIYSPDGYDNRCCMGGGVLTAHKVDDYFVMTSNIITATQEG